MTDADVSDDAISQVISRAVITGGSTAWLSDTDPWSLHIYWKRNGGLPRVSLALATAARAWNPPPALAPTYELTVGAVEVHGIPGRDRRVPITAVYAQPAGRKKSPLNPGDAVGSYYLE